MAKNKESSSIVEEAEAVATEDPVLSATLRADNAYEYHVSLARSLLEDIMDSQTPTRFIEVTPLSAGGTVLHGMRRFLNTMYVKEIDVRGF